MAGNLGKTRETGRNGLSLIIKAEVSEHFAGAYIYLCTTSVTIIHHHSGPDTQVTGLPSKKKQRRLDRMQFLRSMRYYVEHLISIRWQNCHQLAGIFMYRLHAETIAHGMSNQLSNDCMVLDQ